MTSVRRLVLELWPEGLVGAALALSVAAALCEALSRYLLTGRIASHD